MAQQASSKTTSVRLPAFINARTAFFVVFIGGLVLCMPGISQAPTHGWLQPVSLAGSALGGLAILLGLAELFRWRVGPIQSDRAAFVALLAIIGVKVVLALFYAL